MIDKAVVLLSGGLDSATCLGLAVHDHGAENVSAISVQYGQKHSMEIKCAEKLAEYYNVPLYTLDLTMIFEKSNCSLLKHSTEDIPEGSYADQQAASDSVVVSTYVPFRNGLMLSAAASYAISLYPDNTIYIYLGNHADDAAGSAYPDCSEAFSNLIAGAIYEGTGKQVHAVSPFATYTKADIVRMGLSLKVPYQYTRSCYTTHEKSCGKCGTCIDRLKAFAANGVKDPVEYEV